jgi:hypothetical protein
MFVGLQYVTYFVRQGSVSRRGKGITQPPILWVPGVFPGVKWLGSVVQYSLSYSAEVKNGWSYTSTPVYTHGADRDNFTFY